MRAAPELRFRPFQSEDLGLLKPWLVQIGHGLPRGVEDRAWAERISSDPRILCFSGECGGEVAGMFRLDLAPDRSAEITLIVAPTRRRRGFGRLLLEEALERARGLGLRRLVAVIDDDNLGAQAFFTAAGFEGTGVWVPGFVHLARVVHGAGSQPPLEIVV